MSWMTMNCGSAGGASALKPYSSSCRCRLRTASSSTRRASLATRRSSRILASSSVRSRRMSATWPFSVTFAPASCRSRAASLAQNMKPEASLGLPRRLPACLSSRSRLFCSSTSCCHE
eukprot:scaffold55086_cov64-Phaeocystis_antarctica.AAC.6